MKSIPQRAVASWVLYDLANTIFSMCIISLYFPLWVVNVQGGTDFQFGVANSLSMGAVFLLSPLLGALTDQAGRRMPFLAVSTLACIVLTSQLGKWGLPAGLAIYAAANLAYQAGIQFYDSLLPEVSREGNRGRIGGIGIAVGYLGSLIGIGAGTLVIGRSAGVASAVQNARYDTMFGVVALLFLLFSLPCFLFVRERPRPGSGFNPGMAAQAVRQVVRTFREALRRRPHLVRFLAGRFFYTDAINTVIMFMGIYVANEAGFSESRTGLVMAVAILFAVAGGYLWGGAVDRLGPRRVLFLVLAIWMADFTWGALVGLLKLPGWTFWPVPILAGIALGGTWAADRPWMLKLAPPNQVGEYFGLYNMVGRFSAVLGPFIWGFVADKLGLGRPMALLTLLLAIVVSAVILRKVPDRQTPVGS